jgi:hypothetical protein
LVNHIHIKKDAAQNNATVIDDFSMYGEESTKYGAGKRNRINPMTKGIKITLATVTLHELD